MNKLQIRRLVAGCGLFVMGLLCMAEVGHAYTTPPVMLYITVPHKSSDGTAHNTVTFTIVEYTQEKGVKVKISGSVTQTKEYWVELYKRVSVDVKNNDGGNVGRVAGSLNAIKVGQTILVSFTGTVNGWSGYGNQGSVKFPSETGADTPLTVGAIVPE